MGLIEHTMKFQHRRGFLFILSIGWFITAALPASAQSMNPNNADAVERGETTYARHCASCHGAKLEGEPNWRERKSDGTLPSPPHDKTGHTWHHPADMLFQITKRGGKAFAPPSFKSAMPAFGGLLTDKEIWAVLSFIKSRWPKIIQKKHDRISKQMRHK